MEDPTTSDLKNIDDEVKQQNTKAFQVYILTKLARGRKEDIAGATEEIVKHICNIEKIYTIRDDIKTEIWIYRDGIYIPKGASYIKAYVRDIVGDAYSSKIVNEILNKIIVDTYIDSDKFFIDEPPELVVCENGILNIITKELSPFSSDFFFFNKLHVVYDKDAKCPAIISHFSEVLAHKDDSLIMQELFGYLIYRTQKYAKAFMFCGDGRNGKGATLHMIKMFLGMENVANIPLQQLESDLFAASELHKRLANLGGDISKTALKGVGMFQSITGGDLISAARKFMTRVNFVCYAKQIFCANEIPMTSTLTLAFFNRWILLDFPYTFLKKNEYDLKTPEENKANNIKLADVDMYNKLTSPSELSGLLNWALVGLDRLNTKKDFSYSFTTNEVRIKWLRKSNSFYAYCLDELAEEYNGKIIKNDLRKAYSSFCRLHKLEISSDVTIKRILTEMFGVGEDRYREKGQQIPYWLGIVFKNGGTKGMGFDNGEDGETFSIPTINQDTNNTTNIENNGNLPKDSKKSGKGGGSGKGCSELTHVQFYRYGWESGYHHTHPYQMAKEEVIQENPIKPPGTAQNSEVIQTPTLTTPKPLKSIIIDLIESQSNENGQTLDLEALEWLASQEGINPEDFKKTIEILKREGTIFEPRPGKIQLLY